MIIVSQRGDWLRRVRAEMRADMEEEAPVVIRFAASDQPAVTVKTALDPAQGLIPPAYLISAEIRTEAGRHTHRTYAG